MNKCAVKIQSHTQSEFSGPHTPCILLGTAGVSTPLALIHVVQWEHHGLGESKPWVPLQLQKQLLKTSIY